MDEKSYCVFYHFLHDKQQSIGIGWDTYLQVVSQKPCLPSSEWHNEFLVLSKMLCHHGFFSRGQQVVHRNVYRNSISNTLNQNMHERIGSSFTNNFLSISNIWQSQKRVSYFGIYIFLLLILYMFHFISFPFYILLLSRKEIKTNIKKHDFLKESPPSKPPQSNLCGFSQKYGLISS